MFEEIPGNFPAKKRHKYLISRTQRVPEQNKWKKRPYLDREDLRLHYHKYKQKNV
jgi:hypothetical protein